jgi:hypothetical protein
MTTSTSRIWFRRLLVTGAVLAGATASAAGAAGRPPDVRDVALANLAATVSRSPDVRDAADRYAATHQLDTRLPLPAASTVARPPDVRDTAISLNANAPDVFERYVVAHPYGLGVSSVSVPRPPDVNDTALALRYGSIVRSPSGFHWGDWAIGIGSSMGVLLLLGAAFLASRQLRHRVQTA